MRPTALPHVALPALLAALAACATTATSRPAGTPSSAAARNDAPRPAAAPPSAPSSGSLAAPTRRELTPRAQRLFDEALATAEEQKRLKVPTDWEILERRWRAVAEAEPIAEAYFNVGVALEHRGRVDDARAAYRRALEIEPRFAPAAVNLALLDEPKDARLAARAWDDLSRRFPDDPIPRIRLAALYESAGQHDEAWKLAREALMRDPRSVGAYKVMMRIALDRGRFDLAELLAVKARKLDQSDPDVVSFMGDVHARLKDDAAAVSQWKKAVAMKENFLPARYALLGNALGKQHWEGVSEQAQAILRVAPTDARVQVILGIAYRYLGQPDKALAAFDEAERLGSPKLAEVHLARGVTLMKSKEQCEPALAELRRYIATAGPALASEGPAPRLQRECEQIIAASRQAEEAAREMKAQAEREAAKKATSPGAQGPNMANPGAVQATPGAADATATHTSGRGTGVPTR